MLGGYWTLNTGESPSAVNESFLSQILEDEPPRKYALSKTACLGILRRAKRRGRKLPPLLEAALTQQAGEAAGKSAPPGKCESAEKKAEPGLPPQGLLSAEAASACLPVQPEQHPPLFAAGFSAGQGERAGGIGYQEECSPALRAAESGSNRVPSILLMHGDVAGQPGKEADSEHPGSKPRLLLFENHSQDARYTGPLEVAPVLSTSLGTGGNGTPLAVHTAVFVEPKPHESCPSMADRSFVVGLDCRSGAENGDLCGTLQAHPSGGYSLHTLHPVRVGMLVRRLTPLECERLMGFPDGWTALPGASDSARYQALGNSVAIPCVEFVMKGIACVLQQARRKE